MPHHIYETKALILGSTPSREADRQLLLFSREFGLIYATAQGVRELKSKLRYSLQPYSLSSINLVHGRSGWRITNARLETNFFFDTRESNARLTVLARVSALLWRLLTGQERNEVFFDSLIPGIRFLAQLPETSLPEAELLLVLCILHHLGYLGESGTLSSILVSGFWNLEAVFKVSRMRTMLVHTVNESLRASHL
ncbi:MAG TPA: recombination protein O N-terminal domain-containing protein [Candidatus Paceibacterota bacterium]